MVVKGLDITAGYGAAEKKEIIAAKSTFADGHSADIGALTAREQARPQIVPRWSHADAAFVAHLIATAEHAPQTRTLRRASVQDAMSYYTTMAKVSSSGGRVRAGVSRVV